MTFFIFSVSFKDKEEVENDLYNIALYNPYKNIQRVKGSNEQTTYTLIDDALYHYFKGTKLLLEKKQPTTLSNGMYYTEMDNFMGIKFIHQKSNDEIKKLYRVCGVIK